MTTALHDRVRCNRRARLGEFWTNTDMAGGPLDPFRLVAHVDELETAAFGFTLVMFDANDSQRLTVRSSSTDRNYVVTSLEDAAKDMAKKLEPDARRRGAS